MFVLILHLHSSSVRPFSLSFCVCVYMVQFYANICRCVRGASEPAPATDRPTVLSQSNCNPLLQITITKPNRTTHSICFCVCLCVYASYPSDHPSRRVLESFSLSIMIIVYVLCPHIYTHTRKHPHTHTHFHRSIRNELPAGHRRRLLGRNADTGMFVHLRGAVTEMLLQRY